jgi:hypothetical protein
MPIVSLQVFTIFLMLIAACLFGTLVGELQEIFVALNKVLKYCGYLIYVLKLGQWIPARLRIQHITHSRTRRHTHTHT